MKTVIALGNLCINFIRVFDMPLIVSFSNLLSLKFSVQLLRLTLL